jgi:hypothetical protein
MARLTLILAVMAAWSVAGFAGMNNGHRDASSSSPVDHLGMSSSRRSVLEKVANIGFAGIITTASLPAAAAAAAATTIDEETPKVTTRMGGQLERYLDTSRGWQILAPSGWNKFEGEVGAYDVKWQDLVDPRENIKVSSTPVKSNITSM